ncbi:MAG TPA: hypothetical protein PKY12_05600 [Catalimonadaceae bacterium]|jgi:hypothetical protein|nr:hypothetical protein [Catalimonadaceae bacterium]
MVSIVEAQTFIKVMEGGTTLPWLVICQSDAGPKPYVVKLYKSNYTEQNEVIFRELVCSYLANQFDLATPEAVLVRMSPEFLSTLPERELDQYKQTSEGLKLGTAYIEPPYVNYSPALVLEFLKPYDLASVFAFDQSMLNKDRREGKPNLLLKENDVYLIDHEICLEGLETGLKQFKMGLLPHQAFDHLFLQVLQKLSPEEKQLCFDTFFEYLEKAVNFDGIRQISFHLEDHEIPCHSSEEIYDYLCALKSSSISVRTALIRSIQ